MSRPSQSPTQLTSPLYHTHLLTSLSTINTQNPPVHTCSTGWSFNGLLSGPTSIAYLFYKLSALYPGHIFKGQDFLEWAECYLELGRVCGGDGRIGVGVGCEGVVGTVVRGVVEGDEGVIGGVCGLEGGGVGGGGRVGGPWVGVSWGRGHERDGDGDFRADSDWGSENNWTGGRAGYLYLLRVLRNRFPNSRPKIQKTIDRVVDHITSDKEFQQGTINTAKIHIIVGMVTQIVLSRVTNHAHGLEQKLDEVLKLQDGDGSWNETTPWIVNSLDCISRYFPPSLRDRIIAANERARSFLYHADTESSPPTLQAHGLVTRALAFSDPQDQRFHQVLGLVTGEYLDETRPGWRFDAGKRDGWVGLESGEAGRAWGWVVAEFSGVDVGSGSGVGMERRILGYNDV